jgi:ribonuclease Z
MKSKMLDKHHMLFSDAAKLAAAAEVRELWLTHFSPALVNPKENLSQIQKIFPETIIPYDGYSKTLL